MPQISKKGQAMPQSPIRKLVPYAERAKQKGIKVYHLNIGQPDIETPKIALDAVKKADLKILEYTRSDGSSTYRKKLADYYKKHGIDVSHKDIVVTTGGSEALIFTIGSIADSGDEIIIPEPFYANYNGIAVSSGVKIVPVVSDIDHNFALPSIAEFEKLITDKTRAIVICNPGNPTGYLYSKEEIEQLKAMVLKHDIFLIADEVYREFVYDGYTHHSVMSEPGLDEHAIMVDSVSKRYSMCGARIGCIVSRNKEVIEASVKFAQARLSPPTYELIAAEAALDTPDSYFEMVNREYTERRKVLLSGLQKIPGIKVSMPKGAFYCLAELPIKDSDDFAQWLLEDFSLDSATVMVAPASGFYSTPGVGKNQVRIAYVLKKEDLECALKVLAKALEVYTSKS
ncbi:MAG: aspartate aminotransferase [Flavobacteriales bacterium]|nr:MAG: aspartate aminotransferase [Flavobacteriales bacterium]